MPSINPVRVKRYGRSPWSSMRGFPQFQRNMLKLSKLGDERTLVEGFNRIGRQMRDQMEHTLKANLNPPTDAYIRKKKGKAMYLRERALVAKPFSKPGGGKSFVAINYRYGPHAHWFEFGTGERFTKTGARRGKIPRAGGTKKSKSTSKAGTKRIKLGYFRPTINYWRRSGKFINEVRRVVSTSLDVATRGMR